MPNRANAIARELTEAAIAAGKISIFEKEYGVCCRITVLAIYIGYINSGVCYMLSESWLALVTF